MDDVRLKYCVCCGTLLARLTLFAVQQIGFTMRTLLAGLMITTALPAFADTFEPDTNVTAALITGAGGVVTYSADVELPAGRHTVIVHLPRQNWGKSVLDTRFGDTNAVRIISQAAGTDFATPVIRPPSAEELSAQAALEAAIAKQRSFEQDYEAKQADLTAAQTQLQLLQVTAETGFGTPDAGLNAEQILAVAQALGDTTKQASLALAQAKTNLLAMEPQRKALRKAVTEARETLASVQPESHVELIQITTDIDVASPQSVTIEFDNLETASWQPYYVAELDQDGDTGVLQLHRKANIFVGNQGEKPLDDWANVNVTLSTANLADQIGTRIPQSDLRTLVDEARLRKTKSISGASYEANRRVMGDALAEPVIETQEESAIGVSFSGQTLLFNLGTNAVDWKTESTSFNIDTLTFDLDLYAMANAAQDENPFLYTDLKNETGGVLLSGPVSLHRDGTLIGDTYLPQLVPNQDEPVGLGPLYGIQLKRDILSVEEGDSGFITSKSEINRSFRTTLISSLSYDMPVKLLDVIPTSENEDLVIRMDASPRPSDENRKGKRGVLVWDLNLGAGDTEIVNFGYQMKWPSGQVPVQK
ncbi:mucoidy inhibitor MuiA family protein [Amylibacter sp. IMCC11727]|uniref:DUF4139 domain-containing protein n=1 Tax=Amylibacter sp. IMCC11727 TaxID=3039851 RepID=UPI00244DB4CD|nr:mucoidy inhibitor MuiA family protein [Amylibacter sp. IMCC11727]WGI22172.1 mucoidy inhibitor MuiA family protein [Amylibacter sp. IMCC11727]